METFFPTTSCGCRETRTKCNCIDTQVYNAMSKAGWSIEDTYKVLLRMTKYADKQQQAAVNRVTREALGECPSFLITFHFDQKLEESELLRNMEELREALGKSNYKWFSEACLCQEFYSGITHTWNPHIHLATIKTTPKSNIVQALNRNTFIKKLRKEGVIYKPFDVQIGKDTRHLKYVRGEKKEEKEENCLKDIAFREDHQLSDYYNL